MAPDPTEILVVFVTAPEARALELARALVQRHRAACVNILPGVRSIYAWKGSIQDESESLLMMKTSRGAFESLRSVVREMHPYEVPEIVGVPVAEVHEPYRAWVLESVSERGEGAPG